MVTTKSRWKVGILMVCLTMTSPALALAPGIDELQLGIQAYGANKNAAALTHFTKALTTRPDDPFVLLGRAETLLNLNRPKEALVDLNKALNVARYKGGVHSRLGLCYLELRQPALAEKELETSIKLNELDMLRWANWLDYLNLASAKQSLHKFREAAAAKAMGTRLRLQQSARDTREALDMPGALSLADKAVAAQPDNVYSHYLRGLIRLNASSTSEAIEDFNTIIKKQPNDPLPYYFRADAFLDSGRLEEAIKDYSKIISLAPSVVAIVDIAETGRCKSGGRAYDESAVTLADIYYLRASAYRTLGKLGPARADLTNCLKLAPDDLEAKILNVDFLTAEGKKKEALQELERLVKGNPKDIHCLQMAATAYSKLGQTEKALDMANSLVKSSMGETNALLCRAKIFETQGKWQESIKDYTAAINNEDFDEDALEGRANAYMHIGDWKSALNDCNAAIKKADGNKPELLKLKAKIMQNLAPKGAGK